MRVGIFGGTFNPIHYGHLRAAEEIWGKLEFDKILFIPSANPPLKTDDLADATHRYRMAELAIAKNKFFRISDIELKIPGKSYTLKTLRKLIKSYAEVEFSFILGIDAFLDIGNWWNPEKLLKIVNFVIISKPPYCFMDLQNSHYITNIDKKILKKLDNAELEISIIKLKSKKDAILIKLTPMGISSTEIRRLIKYGESIKYLLPEEVESYIISNRLYK
jgi:nicotinate-nucleotide adenylyltransferase